MYIHYLHKRILQSYFWIYDPFIRKKCNSFNLVKMLLLNFKSLWNLYIYWPTRYRNCMWTVHSAPLNLNMCSYIFSKLRTITLLMTSNTVFIENFSKYNQNIFVFNLTVSFFAEMQLLGTFFIVFILLIMQ